MPSEPAGGAFHRGRWHCTHGGLCRKNFARREHLIRHLRTHLPPESQFSCNVCQQKFNRHDSLNRHMLRHGEEFKPPPSGRSKRACITCHRGKIKCDGNQPCSKCVARDILCNYNRPDLNDAGKDGSPPEMSVGDQAALGVEEEEEEDEDEAEEGEEEDEEEEERAPEVGSNNSIASVLFPKLNVVDWTAMKVQIDRTKAEQQPLPESILNTPDSSLCARPTLPDRLEAEYLAAYLEHFHHRWPVVHRPSYEDNEMSSFLQCAMKMIGAWALGLGESKLYAVSMHRYLMSHIPAILSKRTSNDRFQGTLPSSLCQTAFMCVVLSFYSGLERSASRAVVLLSSLVAILRETSFFDPETIMPDEKPGYFRPLAVARLGERQRLALYLFKIDSYFSLLKGYPPLITIQDLHFPPPSSLGHWDADGLHVWESRIEGEPALREKTSILDMISNAASNPSAENGIVLIEDLQLLMYSMQAPLRRLHQEPIPQIAFASSDSLKTQLDAIKIRLDQMTSQDSDPTRFGDEKFIPYRYYYGYESHIEANWQKAAITKAKTLLFDALSLYHLLGIHLYTDVALIRQLMKDLASDPKLLNKRHKHAQELRRTLITTWGGSCAAKAALCHANSIVTLHKRLSLDPQFERRGLDPITYVALSTSVLIVWAFCIFGQSHCQICTVTNGGLTSKTYIEIDGIQVCVCRLNPLMEKFRSYLPERWEFPQIAL
ncbi:hypothetical protein BJ875DRAFT_222212 [Amylocarpus encephaloides]|uniref:Neosartiricin B biosynthesis protein R n=1 Tax=Amylocarpus encephaloides TaxID=45428 RepID=A0A9P7YMY3_9HELO|nr:hypothetical protein BJ875DRAFT_222212 [Amylocarpus encephaloides]